MDRTKEKGMLDKRTRKYLSLQSFCAEDGREWGVLRLVKLSQGIPAKRVGVRALVRRQGLSPTIRSLTNGDRATVLAADLRHPIILSAEGELMDGHHRLSKAHLLGKRTILARRFDETPEPD